MKIDTSTIQGYAEMTPEQKIAYFEGYEFNDNSAEISKLQEAIKRSNAENAEYKRKEQARMTEEEKKAAADAEFQANYEKIQKEIQAYKLKDELIESGFTADEIKQLVDGNCSAKAYAEVYKAREEKLKSSLNLGALKGGTPKGGLSGAGGNDEEDFATKLAKTRFMNSSKSIKEKYKN